MIPLNLPSTWPRRSGALIERAMTAFHHSLMRRMSAGESGRGSNSGSFAVVEVRCQQY
jgi:hypothetical protein